MICYFSGTGNSLYIAKHLAQTLGHSLKCMVNENETIQLNEGEDLGFVIPVYAWGVPKVVENFISKASIPHKPNFTFAVLTCGDDMAYTDLLLNKLLQKHNIVLNAVYSVQMRNTYVCLPGFDVDSEQVEISKQQCAEKRVQHIAQSIAQHQMPGSKELVRGSIPYIKSYVLRPLFNLFLMSDKGFRVDDSKCVHCNKCINYCPLHNISLNNQNKLEWNGHCTHCLCCYHICPKHAINYRIFTCTKGQVKINV